MLTALRGCRRLTVIGWTLLRYDALWFLEPFPPLRLFVRPARLLRRRNLPDGRGQRLAEALTRLGPAFIKLGQALSMRADLIGAEVAEPLARLQDRMPPFPAATARATVEREFGRPLETLFSDFTEEPAAAASIAQVHRAVTTDGRAVAVKILRPDVERRFARDLELFFWLAALAERLLPKVRRLRLTDVVTTVRGWVAAETNLLMEAAAAAELAENSGGDDGVRIPAVDWDRSARRVLTTAWVEGLRIDDLDGLRAAGHDPDALLRQSAQLLFFQVFRDGFFHADLHPGNVFVDGDGNIVPVDFGIMGRTDPPVRRFLTDIVAGFLTGDYRRVADAHFEMGMVPPQHSRDDFRLALRAIGAPLLDKPMREISIGRLLVQLFRTTEDFDMQTRPELLLLQKTLLAAEGVGRMLNPDVNMWVLIRPVIEDWLVAEHGPEARLRDALRRTARLAEDLPILADKTGRGLDALIRLEARMASPDTAWRGMPALSAAVWLLLGALAGAGGLFLLL